jgi:hypothetical protein
MVAFGFREPISFRDAEDLNTECSGHAWPCKTVTPIDPTHTYHVYGNSLSRYAPASNA